MLEVTETAKNQLDKIFETQEKAPIRVYLTAG